MPASQLNTYISSSKKRAKTFYRVLNDLNNDPFIYMDKKGNSKGRAGKFYLCWIDSQKCLHHFKHGQYKYPYSSSSIYDLLKIVHDDPKRNWFIAPNTFRSKQIRDERFTNNQCNVRTITGFYLDFDVMNSGISMDRFYKVLPVILDKCHIVPNAVINSGHGYHVYILLNEGNPVNDPKVITHWKRIQRDMIHAVGQECTRIFHKSIIDSSVSDISRILRVAGSFNMKNPDNPLPVKVKYIDLDTDDRPSFKQLLWQWHDWYVSRRNYKRTKKDLGHQLRKQQRHNGHTTRTLNYARCTDLFTLARERKQEHILNGYRDLILFYYETCAIRPNYKDVPTYSDSQTIVNVKALNKSFLKPLKNNQLWSIIYELPKIHQMIRHEKVMKQHHMKFKTRYCPSNQTIIDDLNISEHEQRLMKTIIGRREAKRRKPINYQNELIRRKKQRKQVRMKRNWKMYQMHLIGFTYNQISKKFDKSKKTVQRAVKLGNSRGWTLSVPFKCKLVSRKRQSVVQLTRIHIIYKNTGLLKYLLDNISNSLVICNNKAVNDVYIRRIRDD